jgi:uncharacterized protein (TIGR02271 family)
MDAGLAEEMVGELTGCIQTLFTGADICQATVRVPSRQSGSKPAAAGKLGACWTACRACRNAFAPSTTTAGSTPRPAAPGNAPAERCSLPSDDPIRASRRTTAMNSPQSPLVTGARVIGGAGELLGHVRAVYVDATGAPAWAAIQYTDHSALVPLQNSRFDGTTLQVPYDAARLQTAPHHDPITLISHPAGDDLACHYGLLPAASADGAPPVAVGSDVVEDTVMVRSQEQLRVATVNVAVGRARLVKYIVTEQMTYTIPVSREEVRLEYDPLPAHQQTLTDTAPAQETYEVIRHAEQVRFSTQVVPVERVRLVRHVRTTAQALTEQVRAEQISYSTSTPPPTTDTTDT